MVKTETSNPFTVSYYDLRVCLPGTVRQTVPEFDKPVPGRYAVQCSLSIQDEQRNNSTSIVLSQSISYTISDSKSNRDVNNLDRALISFGSAYLSYLTHSYPDRNVHHVERTKLSHCRGVQCPFQ